MKLFILFILFITGCEEYNSHRDLYNHIQPNCNKICYPEKFNGHIIVRPDDILCVCEK